MPSSEYIHTVKVWDPLVRLFHWSLVVTFALASVTGEAEEDTALNLHVYAGYVIGGLILFRLMWGFVGTTHARFADFVTGPGTVLAYARDALCGRARRFLGHNPLGGAMVIALLTMLTLTTMTGLLLYGADEHAGPFANFMRGTPEWLEDPLEEMHEFFANTTLALAGLHVLGVAWSSWQHNENLVRAMFTGRKHA